MEQSGQSSEHADTARAARSVTVKYLEFGQRLAVIIQDVLAMVEGAAAAAALGVGRHLLVAPHADDAVALARRPRELAQRRARVERLAEARANEQHAALARGLVRLRVDVRLARVLGEVGALPEKRLVRRCSGRVVAPPRAARVEPIAADRVDRVRGRAVQQERLRV